VVAEGSLHYESDLDFEECQGKCELIVDINFTT
jgi:hypothetical protein